MSGPLLGGGKDSAWLTPIRPDGLTRQWENAPADIEIRGTHTGLYAGLNVGNPQPGKLYQWVYNSANSLMSARMKGGVVVGSNDEDFPAYRLGFGEESDLPTPVDTASEAMYQDVILMRFPEERIRQIAEQNAAQAQAQVQRGADGFLRGGSPNETILLGQGGPTRFARRDHSTQLMADDQVTANWTADRDQLER